MESGLTIHEVFRSCQDLGLRNIKVGLDYMFLFCFGMTHIVNPGIIEIYSLKVVILYITLLVIIHPLP